LSAISDTVIRSAWTNERFSHHGRFWQVDDCSLTPRPQQKPSPPICVINREH
jgi:alkanesulfonate monooxygenase SsuD/methylene tetrahydromethanopterin reductase-like flavin-dependent oxidoreductase (luciferase family)